MATNTERIAKDLIAAWNSHDVDKVASLFTDDCVYEDAAADETMISLKASFFHT